MFVVARIILCSFLLVLCDRFENGKILNGIEPVSNAMESLDYYSCGSGSNKILYECNVNMVDIGHRLFPNLTNFAESITMLSDQFNESDSNNQAIKSELTKIKTTFGNYELYLPDYLWDKQYKTFREKFESSILNNVNNLQKVFSEFIENPNSTNKDALRNECNTTNSMKDVLTDLHIEIVNKDGNNGTFNQLLDGGVSL